MATVSLSSLRSRLRTYIKDNDKTDADDLDLYINHAIVQWTTDLPIASSNEYTIVDDQHAYDLPSNMVTVMSVYGYFESASRQEYLAPMTIKPGAWADNDEPRRYIVGFPLETNLYLPRLPSAGSTFTLYYGAHHNWLDIDTDLLDLRSHRWGERAVLCYSAYLRLNPTSTSRAKLEQWATRRELNVGNPLEEEANRWLGEYERLLQENSAPEMFEFVPLGRVR